MVLREVREQLATAGDLGRQLEGLRQPVQAIEAAPAGDRLEEIIDDYTSLSNRMAETIAATADEQDEEAVDELTRLIGLDLQVAQQLIGQAGFEGEPDDGPEAGPESFVQATPDPALVRQLKELGDLGAVAQEALWTRPPDPVAAPTMEAEAGPADIDTSVGAILDEAGETITTTFRAVTWASVAGDFADLGGDDRRRRGQARREYGRDGGQALLEKGEQVGGQGPGCDSRQDHQVPRRRGAQEAARRDQGKDRQVRDDVPGEGVASRALGLAWQRQAVVGSCEERLADQTPERIAEARTAVSGLAGSSHASLRWVRRGNTPSTGLAR